MSPKGCWQFVIYREREKERDLDTLIVNIEKGSNINIAQDYY